MSAATSPRKGLLAAMTGGFLLVASNAHADESCDARPGAEVYATKCAVCHSLIAGEPGAVGPSLFGIVGRRPASVPGFVYSAAMKSRSDLWTPATLDWYLIDPPGRVPGTYMAFSGLKSSAARAALICFLGTVRKSLTH